MIKKSNPVLVFYNLLKQTSPIIFKGFHVKVYLTIAKTLKPFKSTVFTLKTRRILSWKRLTKQTQSHWMIMA
jgi:hypothetical protein